MNNRPSLLNRVYRLKVIIVALILLVAGVALCGVSPMSASSGRTDRHRLNRGGDRAANGALYTVVMVRMRYDARTRDYVARRTKQGLSKREIMRCLKRYAARELPPLIRNALPEPAPEPHTPIAA